MEILSSLIGMAVGGPLDGMMLHGDPSGSPVINAWLMDGIWISAANADFFPGVVVYRHDGDKWVANE